MSDREGNLDSNIPPKRRWMKAFCSSEINTFATASSAPPPSETSSSHDQVPNGAAFDVENPNKEDNGVSKAEALLGDIVQQRRQETEIFVGGFDTETTTEEDIREVFEEIGEVVEVRLKTGGKADGFGFVHFAREADANKALTEYPTVEICGRQCRTAPAKRHIDKNLIKSDHVKTVYIEHLPSHWDEEKVKDCFGKYGEIENIVLAEDISSRRRKDTAFVCYTTREAALACIEASSRDSMVKAKVSLANSNTKHKQMKYSQSPRSSFNWGYYPSPARKRPFSELRAHSHFTDPWGYPFPISYPRPFYTSYSASTPGVVTMSLQDWVDSFHGVRGHPNYDQTREQERERYPYDGRHSRYRRY